MLIEKKYQKRKKIEGELMIKLVKEVDINSIVYEINIFVES